MPLLDVVMLGFLYQAAETNAAWTDIRPPIQTLRLAVENHRV
jgi:shikimate 5-dehydrogenase